MREPSRVRSIVAVGLGGAVGTVGRVALSSSMPVDPATFPWSTFVENVVGAFLLGLVMTLLTVRADIDPVVRLGLCTGMLGSFTTFSALAVEVNALVVDAALVTAIVYATATLICGLAGACAGILLGRRWWGKPARQQGQR